MRIISTWYLCQWTFFLYYAVFWRTVFACGFFWRPLRRSTRRTDWWSHFRKLYLPHQSNSEATEYVAHTNVDWEYQHAYRSSSTLQGRHSR